MIGRGEKVELYYLMWTRLIFTLADALWINPFCPFNYSSRLSPTQEKSNRIIKHKSIPKWKKQQIKFSSHTGEVRSPFNLFAFICLGI